MQIKDFIGKMVQVKCIDETEILGELVFYHFDSQAIHLCNYQRRTKEGNTDTGQLLVINQNTWSEICVKGG